MKKGAANGAVADAKRSETRKTRRNPAPEPTSQAAIPASEPHPGDHVTATNWEAGTAEAELSGAPGGGPEVHAADELAQQTIEGYVDGVFSGIVQGWAVCRDPNDGRVAGSVTVEVSCDGMPIAEIVADKPRPDVAQLLECTSNIGFAFEPPERCRTGRDCLLSFRSLPLHRELTNSPLTARFEPRPRLLPTKTSLAIAVAIHAFYEGVLPQILSSLDGFPFPYHLYVSCPTEKADLIRQILARRGVSATVVEIENIGMDLLGFLNTVAVHDLNRYDIVLKLHTKNDATEQGRALLDLSLRTLVGSPELIKNIVGAFEFDPLLTMVGPNDLYRPAHYAMYNNRELLQQICGLLGVRFQPVDWGFFAGSMFWLQGALLNPLCAKYANLYALAKAQDLGKERTGTDGAVAHALERLWGGLTASETRKVGLTYVRDANFSRIGLRIARDSVALKEPIRRLGTTEVLVKWSRAADDIGVIRTNGRIDAPFYKRAVPECVWLEIDPDVHYCLSGELLDVDPTPDFSTSFYKLSRPDVVRKSHNVFAHYHSYGKKERMTGAPQLNDWTDIGTKIGLFDSKWYSGEHEVVSLCGMSAKEHYHLVGAALGLPTSANFVPAAIPILSRDDAENPASLGNFLRNHYLAEHRSYDEIQRVLQNNDFSLIPELVQELFSSFEETAAPMSALALSYIRRGQWPEAREVFSRYWLKMQSGSLAVRHRRSLISENRLGNEVFAEAASVAAPAEGKSVSVCVYTALFGDIDRLPPILVRSKYCRFVCFTDTPGDVDGWEYRIADPDFTDPNLKAKVFKLFPEQFLQGFDYTLWVDANTLLTGRLDELLERCLLGNPFVMFPHPERCDIYSEAVAVVESLRHSPEAILAQLQAYQAAGLPPNTGLVEASFIWRKCGCEALNTLAEEWWSEILRRSRRDQLSLGFLMWKTGFRPRIVPEEAGTVRENKYFFKLPHLKLPYEVSPITTGTRRPRVAKQADIWVLYGTKYAATGSTVLRGQQLSELIREAVGEERGVIYSSFDEIDCEIVFLTKGYLTQHGIAAVKKLKDRGNIVLADFVDAHPNPEMIPLIDVLVASSIRGHIDYRQRFPGTRSHHVTHHVNLLIPPGSPPSCFRAGYFGELVNTIRNSELDQLVEFVSVDTKNEEYSWIKDIQDFSFHYAVRRSREIDGHKPFLKGFVAAQCGANILIQANAGDAQYYLGHGYPYLLPANPTIEEITDALRQASDSFGGPEWRVGLSIMEEVRQRSSRQSVVGELRSLFGSL